MRTLKKTAFGSVLAAAAALLMVFTEPMTAQAVTYSSYYSGGSFRNEVHHSARKTFRYSNMKLQVDFLSAKITVSYGPAGSTSGMGHAATDFGKNVANAQVYCQWNYPTGTGLGAGTYYKSCSTGK